MRRRTSVDRDRRSARELVPRQHQEGAQDPLREHDAGGAAGERQQHALCSELTQEIALACAKRQTDRQLASPGEAGGEQQVGHVRARDQEHEKHRAKQDVERRANRAHHGLGVRLDIHAVVVGELARKRLPQSAHLAGGAFE